MKYFLLVIFFCFTLEGSNVVLSKNMLITPVTTTFENVRKASDFKKLTKIHQNFGFKAKISIWLKIEVENLSNKSIKRYIIIDNPLLEKVFFFDNKKDFIVEKSGMLYVSEGRERIFPSYFLIIKPQEKRLVYVKIENSTTTLQFGFHFKDEQTFKSENRVKEFSIVLFIGLISSFIIYSIFLYIYTRDRSYYLYSFYLITLMFQQLTYIGFLPLYIPSSFVYIDNLIVVPKVSLMIVAAALFAKSFLKMEEFPNLNKMYKILIAVIIFQIPIFGTQFFYVPEITIFLGFLFIMFNTYFGVYVYFHGNRQARFFLVGWLFLFIGYLLMIFDSLGFISMMNKFPELILLITVIEAIFLMLAFVDKLNILTTQRNILDTKLFDEMSNRKKIVEKEVVERTNALQMALEEKVVLFRELNHRVKNNLQLILSIIRLQRFDLKDKEISKEFQKLESRIKAIAKTHQLLCDSEDIVEIDMREYINELYYELSESIIDKNIEFDLQVNATMFLREAVYVGLIINELVSNSIKYAFEDKIGKIFIFLHKKENEYLLVIGDSGRGYNKKFLKSGGLGLKLVDALVVSQLEGTIQLEKSQPFRYSISFKA